MNTRIPALLCGLWALSGCVIDQMLGETATESGSESTAGATGEPVPDSGTTASSQSNTSTPASDEGGSDEGTVTTGSGSDDGSTSDESTGEPPPPSCEEDPERLSWLPHDWEEPIEGITASWAVLEGLCTPLLAGPPTKDIFNPDSLMWSLDLGCTVDGWRDGVPVSSELTLLRLEFNSIGMDPNAFVALMQEAPRIRLASEWWGPGWDTWFVVERPDGTILLDVIAASDPNPAEPNVSINESLTEAVVEMLDGEPWHGDLGIVDVATDCLAFEQTPCSGEQRALELAWNGAAQVVLQTGQAGTIDPNAESAMYRVSAGDVRDYTRNNCGDHASGTYAMSLWLEEP